MADKTITSDWQQRREAASEVVLPSGLKVKMKKPRWMAMLKMGIIPTRLFNIAMGLEKGDMKMPDGKDNYEETVNMMHAYAVACCVEPRFTLGQSANADELSVFEIEDEDLLAIFTKGQQLAVAGQEGEGKALEKFRPGPDGGDAGQGGNAVRPQAEPITGVK